MQFLGIECAEKIAFFAPPTRPLLLQLAVSAMRGHWYAKTRNRWKSVSAFDSIAHHQSQLQRAALCTPINPARPQAWRGFSFLFADLAPTLGGRFRAVSPHFPLSFSARCGRAQRQVRKAKSIKISDLGNTSNPGIFSSIGRRIKIGERESPLKSAQSHVFCWHVLPPLSTFRCLNAQTRKPSS